MPRGFLWSILLGLILVACDSQGDEGNRESVEPEIEETVELPNLDFFPLKSGYEWIYSYFCFQEALDLQRRDTLRGQLVWTLDDSVDASHVTNYFITERFSGRLQTAEYESDDGVIWQWNWDAAQDTTLERSIVIAEQKDSLSFVVQGGISMTCLSEINLPDPLARYYHPDSLPRFGYYAFGPDPLSGQNFIQFDADSGLVLQSRTWTNRKTIRGEAMLKLEDLNRR